MKKLLSLLLAALLAVSVFCIPAYAVGHVETGDTLVFNGATPGNAFGDLLDWTAIVFGNANNIIDVEGTLAVGGNFASNNGLSVNGGLGGQNPADTEDVALLVKGNVNINGYGNVWGQTVVGDAEGNDYRLTNVTPSATTNHQYTVADSTAYFADAKRTAYAVQTAVNALPVNGTVEYADGVYTLVGDPDADVLVYNIDDAVIDSHRFDFNIDEGQTIVLNFTSANNIDLSYGAFCINGSLEPAVLRNYNRNIIVNVPSAPEVSMFHCDLYGILLAPDATLSGSYSDVCGTTIINGLNGTNGFEIHKGNEDGFIPPISSADPTSSDDPADPVDPDVNTSDTATIRIDAPQKMAVAFADGTIYYGGENKEVVVGQEYPFQMCSVNWENGLFDDEENGLRGTVVYRMIALHRDDFLERARAAKEDPERYTVKGIDIIDNEAKLIIVNCDADDTHLETDVNNFFMAYRFHFANEGYDKKTGIDKVVNTPLESLSVNLPLGSTIACNAYAGEQQLGSADVFVAHNSGEGVYDDEYLTSVNDYTWAY